MNISNLFLNLKEKALHLAGGREVKKQILAVVIVVAIGGAVWYFYSGKSADIFSGNVSQGGEYEELAKNHQRGEEFKGYIDKAYERLENDDASDDSGAYLDLGFYKNELGDKKGSITAYKIGVEKFPQHEIMLGNLGHIYEDEKEYDKAEYYYKKVIEVNPRNVRLIIDLASLYRIYMPAEKDEIIPLVENRGLAANPEDPNLMNYLAYYYRYELNNRDKAVAYYHKLLALDPNNLALQVELRNLLQQP